MIKAACATVLALALSGPALADTGVAAAMDGTEAEGEASFSEAERLLWMTDQLRAVREPSVLGYQFKRSGTYEQGFEDTVEFTVTRVKPGGLKDGMVRFFSGERNFPVPPAEDTDVNPVLKIYFQGDVYEMNRLTDPDGQSRERWRYFQRRIKFALAEAAKVEPVTVEFEGKRHAGKAVSFAPFVNDPKRSEFEKFAGKAYRIVVSDTLPGYLYSVETEVPGPPGGPPLIREYLQLAAVKPLPSRAR